MIISSTEFQQNVGFYLQQVELGRDISIQKSKPVKVLYKIVLEKQAALPPKMHIRNNKTMNLINKLNVKNAKENGLAFQERVRQ